MEDITQDTLWRKNGWIAKVTKNLDDDGWAVEMTRIGDNEPALVGPWVMGRDKKNPKPLNAKDFSTLVKTANEVLERAASHAKNALHKSITITLVFRSPSGTLTGEQVATSVQQVVDAAKQKLGATLRV